MNYLDVYFGYLGYNIISLVVIPSLGSILPTVIFVSLRPILKKKFRNNNMKRLVKSFENLDAASNKRMIATAQRKWIEENKDLDAINYIFYRYFTNRFTIYLIKKLKW